MTEQKETFFNWLVLNILNGNSHYPTEKNRRVFLPYFGNDESVISRLFNSFLKIKYPEFDPVVVQEIISKLSLIAAKKALKPGMILKGNVGTGKTFLIQEWCKFRQKILVTNEVDRLQYHFDKSDITASVLSYSPTDLRAKFTASGYEFIQEAAGSRYKGMILFLDDLGVVSAVNNYGNKGNVIEDLICARYEVFKRNPDLEFYATTNLRKKAMEEIMTPRALSRMAEMASSESLTGIDRRTSEKPIIKNWK